MGKYITEWTNIQRHKDEIFSILKPEKIICIFDTETTGTTKSAKIIQFSGSKYRVLPDYTLEKINEFNLYINPEMPIPAKATEINRITDEMVADKEIEKYAAPKVYDYLDSNCDIWVGYNVSFDIERVDDMRLRTHEWPNTKPSIDVLMMARDFTSLEEVKDIKDGKFSLSTIYSKKFPDKPAVGFHDSAEDILATKTLFEYFLQQYISCEPTPKRPIKLERAHTFVNPHQEKQQRINLILSEGEDGDVYYDTVVHKWRCKSTTAAKKLFTEIDLYDLERQFLDKYAYPYGLKEPTDVAKKWFKYKRAMNKKG